MKSPHLRLRQQAHERHRFAQPRRRVVPTQHRRKELPVVPALCNGLPFVIGGHPGALPAPTPQVGQYLGADLARRETAHDGEADRALQIVQGLGREAGPAGRPDASRRHLELVTLVHAPSVDDGLRDYESQRVTDAPNGHFHWAFTAWVPFDKIGRTMHRVGAIHRGRRSCPLAIAGDRSSQSIAELPETQLKRYVAYG